MKNSILLSIAATFACALSACSSRPQIPADAAPSDRALSVAPDYAGTTIPVNIAPLNFSILDEADQSVAHIHLPGRQGIVAAGPDVQIDIDQWKSILADAKESGDSVIVDMYTCSDGKWRQHPSFALAVADEIDPYISYRLIQPSYIGFERIRICQRNLENFSEDEIINNQSFADDENGMCINCHSYQDYNRSGNMQMHIRINHGGTVIARDGKVTKVNLKTPETISAGVYPSWHPTLPLIAYSNNHTDQNFHSLHNNKVEVQDSRSDIMLYDCEKNTIQIIANDSTELETFPYWNHDGSVLYFCSASVPAITEDSMKVYKGNNYRDIKYNIYSKTFDPETRTFGPTDTVFNAAKHGCSATFPRESPDGKYLLFTMGRYGTFHIWHADADLMLANLEDQTVRRFNELNSPNVESYHSFSSNGKWIIFSSRRLDGSYTRLFIAHFDPATGTASKPFLLPQRTYAHNNDRYYSYNIPEFMVKPATLNRENLADAILGEPVQATVAP